MESFGRWLARQRELRGMTVDEVARVTRLSPLAIQALENDRFDELPGKAFVVGYLRAYASCVGLDADELVLRYVESAPAPSEAIEPQGRPFPIAVVIVALLLISVAIWLVVR